jgi:hypothetical protein
VAEKFESMVKLGMANTRMKDFHDLRTLSALFSFESTVLLKADIRAKEDSSTIKETPDRLDSRIFRRQNEEQAVECLPIKEQTLY